MTTVIELRKITLKARGENSNERLEQYIKARDEAFNLMTDGVMDRIKEAAGNGKFRYPIYRWQNTPRFQKDDNEKEEETEDSEVDTKVFFGNSANGKNGLHIMSLINPKGIDRQHSLITKLREFFNSGLEGSSSDDDRRDNQLKVYFEPHKVDFRKCAIFVSWDKKQVHRPSYGGVGVVDNVQRKKTSTGSLSNQFSSMKSNDPSYACVNDEDMNPAFQKKRFVVKGFPTERKFVPRAGYVKRA
jgi:hypothetical protein